MNEAEARAAVVREAREWIGTPYLPMGRVKGSGTDCAQILIVIFHTVLPEYVPLIETGQYPPDWFMHCETETPEKPGRYLRIVEQYARKVDRPARDGDIALFKRGRCIHHGGIVDQWPRLLQALWQDRAHVFQGGVGYDDADKGELGASFVGIWTLKAWS